MSAKRQRDLPGPVSLPVPPRKRRKKHASAAELPQIHISTASIAKTSDRVERGVGRRRKSKKGKSRLDDRLDEVFAGLVPTPPALPYRSREHTEPICPHQLPFRININTTIANGLIPFTCRTIGTLHGPPSDFSIPLPNLLRHCTHIPPSVQHITYGPEITLDTLTRFKSLITPPLPARLPSSITTAYGTFSQAWNLPELEDLYILSVALGAGRVCDLVLNFLIEEFRRLEKRVVEDEFGDAVSVDVLDIGPELLNFLWANDARGLHFFTSAIHARGKEGWGRVGQGRGYCGGVKAALLCVASREAKALCLFTASESEVCEALHHHQGPESFTSYTPILSHSTPGSNPSRTHTHTYTFHITIPPFAPTHRLPSDPSIPHDPIYSLSPLTDGVSAAERHARREYMDKRMLYANEKYNAHHDSAEVCREKIGICRRGLGLLGAGGKEVEGGEGKMGLVRGGDMDMDEGSDSEDMSLFEG